MSKRSKSRRDELIQSMEGLAVPKAPEPVPKPEPKPKTARTLIVSAGLVAGIIVASIALWLLH